MPYFRKLFHQTINHVETIDSTMAPYLDRDNVELDPIECTVTFSCLYELKNLNWMYLIKW